jgi:hypothetical protein
MSHCPIGADVGSRLVSRRTRETPGRRCQNPCKLSKPRRADEFKDSSTSLRHLPEGPTRRVPSSGAQQPGNERSVARSRVGAATGLTKEILTPTFGRYVVRSIPATTPPSTMTPPSPSSTSANTATRNSRPCPRGSVSLVDPRADGLICPSNARSSWLLWSCWCSP